MNNTFYYSTIHGHTIGAEVKAGDYIESVSIGDELTFNDGWEVVDHSGLLGIVWGFKREFTAFEEFASRVTFTIAERSAK